MPAGAIVLVLAALVFGGCGGSDRDPASGERPLVEKSADQILNKTAEALAKTRIVPRASVCRPSTW